MKYTKPSVQKHVNIMASVAMGFSKMAANSRCVCIYHQPEMPKSLAKLRKK